MVSVRARENEQAWAGGSERPGEHGPDVVGGEARDERGARARGRSGGGRLARGQNDPGHDGTSGGDRGDGVEHLLGQRGVPRAGLGLAVPADVGLATVGRDEGHVSLGPDDGAGDRAAERDGRGGREGGGNGVAHGRPTGTRVGRHGGRGGSPVGLDGRVDARAEGHGDAELGGVTRHRHVERDGVTPDLRIERGVGPHCEERLAGEGERLDRLDRHGRGGSGAAIALGLELGTLGAGGSGSQARHDGTPVPLGRCARCREVHDELAGGLGGRVHRVGAPLPLEGGGEPTGVEVGRGRQDRPLVLQPRGTREGRQRPISGRKGAARGGDPARVRQSRRGGLRGGGRLPEGDGRHTEHGEKRESGQATGLHGGD